MSLPTPSSSAGPSKVAIPRLLQRRPEPPRKATISRANRADRACLSCRARKIKCNAARPRCSNCTENTTSCVYVSSRKDRLRTATGQNQDMVALLRDLRDHVSDGSKSRIDDMLVSVVDDIADAAASVRDSHGQHDEVEATQENEQEDSNMRTRFGDATDLSSRKMPFTSRAEAAAAHGQPDVSKHWQETLPSKSAHVNKTSFFLDDLSLETDPDVDPFELPSFEVAEKLLQAYMTSCHNSFPLLAKKGFTHQFYHCT
ncbi:hypothetical protein CC86DRAFT_396207 [Ophiobolus disseminans]|uniref:Zn(2)-C6 fungal-type domain-containing protein n=1 Tax=Ophiobolus disseminans TaxID=1469910 RepID=A0A6A6ZSZ6_9PLEO|nr:hypothetical protein CC86DRAFT_396207 [Ophiobolus disseminans]